MEKHLCSCFIKLNIVKMVILPKLIRESTQILSKFWQARFFLFVCFGGVGIDKQILKFI